MNSTQKNKKQPKIFNKKKKESITSNNNNVLPSMWWWWWWKKMKMQSINIIYEIILNRIYWWKKMWLVVRLVDADNDSVLFCSGFDSIGFFHRKKMKKKFNKLCLKKEILIFLISTFSHYSSSLWVKIFFQFDAGKNQLRQQRHKIKLIPFRIFFFPPFLCT